MIDNAILGDGNKVAQPTQKMVATRNAQSESRHSSKSGGIMLFVVEHKMLDCTDRLISKYHYFRNREDAEKFRKYLILHKISKMNLTEDFEYTYNYNNDSAFLTYIEMQSQFFIYRIKISEPIEGIDQLSFEERVQIDDNFYEGQEQFIPNNFLPF